MGNVILSGVSKGMTVPSTGIIGSTLAVGSTVKLMENGAAAEYLVVHQGLPSSMYDASCDGTWLLRKDCYETRQWHSSDVNDYENSTIHSYLNGDFFNKLGSLEQSVIKQVNIPYRPGSGKSSVVYSGAAGLYTKIFLLSSYEVGFNQNHGSYIVIDGECLSYFNGTGTYEDSKRIVYLNGSAIDWWLRSPRTYHAANTWGIYINGDLNNYLCSNSLGIRPALIVPSTALFDKNTLLIKGVA